MDAQLAVQSLLQENLTEIQRRNPRYSLRSYAGKVGIHAGALSSILSGKRNVSRDLAERIVRRLLLDPQRRAEILGLFPEKRAYRKAGAAAPEPRYLELSAAQFKIAAEWEHFAVMSLIKCVRAKHTPAWIADRLRIPESRARQVVERLVELGLVTKDASGALRRSPKSYRTPDDVASVAMKKHHDQTLDLAKESLHRDSVEQRDMTTLTMAIDPAKLDAAKELIRKFHDDVSDLLESGEQTEVYRLAVQLFPMTRLPERKDP
jgi:uncharacterized protein (TIGR02147 family)